MLKTGDGEFTKSHFSGTIHSMTTILYSTLYGSHLYGTNTPTSDLDIKRIVLPALDDLLLCRPVSNKVVKTNTEKNTKNSADDVDQEYIPLQVFVKDFVEGQTYALELAFSMDGTHADQVIYDWALFDMVSELRSKYLTSNVKAMMGYVFNQANIYSFKGERLNCAREFHNFLLQEFTDVDAGDDQLQDFMPKDSYDDYPAELRQSVADKDLARAAAFDALARKYPKYIRSDVYDIGGGRMRPCFVLLEKTFPWTNTLSHSLNVTSTLINKYGDRAGAASQDNVDWKAMMHAVRIIDEGLELLEHKTITLPRSPADVARLLQIKRGELPIEPLKDELVAKLERLKELSMTCGLPTSGDQKFKQELEEFTLRWLKKFYFD